MTALAFFLFKKIRSVLSNKGLGRIPGVLAIDKFIYKIVKPKKVILIDCQGSKMYINTKDEGIVPSLLLYGYYGKYETELFKKMIKPGMVIVDVGANIGYYSLIAAKMAGENGRVYAFEPDPNSYQFLARNIEINNYSNIIPVEKALSDKRGTRRFFIDKFNFGKNSFSEYNIDKKLDFMEVKTITLDEYFQNEARSSKVDLIKLDVQGAEGLVIEGAGNTLTNNHLKILMEFCPYALQNVGTVPSNLLAGLRKYGFEIKFIDPVHECLRPIEAVRINEMPINQEINLLLEK